MGVKPKRVLSLFRGYTQDAHKVLLDALFEEKYNQMVIVKDIDFFSLCEHHMFAILYIDISEINVGVVSLA